MESTEGFGVLYLLPSLVQSVIVLDKQTTDEAWYHYKLRYDKVYDGETEKSRKEAFLETLSFVIVKNVEHDFTNNWYIARLNGVSDFTATELDCSMPSMERAIASINDMLAEKAMKRSFGKSSERTIFNLNDKHNTERTTGDQVGESVKEMMSYKIGKFQVNDNVDRMKVSNKASVSCFCWQKKKKKCPISKDWSAKGQVFAVGLQRCGDCYAWAATYAVSAAYAIQQNKAPMDLSVQEAKDCSFNTSYYGPGDYLNDGCDGGDASIVFEGLKSRTMYTMTETSNYLPYNKKHNIKLKCDWTMATKKVAVRLTGYGKPKDNTDDCELINQLNKGPIVVSMVTSKKIISWTQKKKTDIFTDLNCTQEYQKEEETNERASHDILLVGYTPDAWIVQNSWGKDWGHNGIAYLTRKKIPGSTDRICNLGVYVSWPNV